MGRQGAGEILPAGLVGKTRSPGLLEVRSDEALGAVEVELEVVGTKKWLLAAVVPFLVGDEQMAFVLGADVTERRRAAEALASPRPLFGRRRRP